MTSGMDSDTWFRRYSTTATPRSRLVVLPHAGGSASFFHPWGRAFGGDTEVLVAKYPGRQERLADPFVGSMDMLADQVTASRAFGAQSRAPAVAGTGTGCAEHAGHRSGCRLR
ncbi:thioesterase II family protein [Streptomyces sp. NPDC005131]